MRVHQSLYRKWLPLFIMTINSLFVISDTTAEPDSYFIQAGHLCAIDGDGKPIPISTDHSTLELAYVLLDASIVQPSEKYDFHLLGLWTSSGLAEQSQMEFVILQTPFQAQDDFTFDPNQTGTLWLLSPTGVTKLLARDVNVSADAACSSNSRLCAYRSTGHSITIVDSDGSIVHTVPNASVPVWNGNASLLAFSQMLPIDPELPDTRHNRSYVISTLEITSGRITQLTSIGIQRDAPLIFSPADDQILFITDRDTQTSLLWSVVVEGGEPEPVLSSADYPRPKLVGALSYWSADGTRLAFMSDEPQPDGQVRSAIWTIDINDDSSIVASHRLGIGLLPLVPQGLIPSHYIETSSQDGVAKRLWEGR